MIEIKEFSPQHASGVVELILPIQQAEFGIPITLEAQPDLQDVPNFYQRGTGNFWVAVDGETVVGSIALLDIGGRQVALRKMFVTIEYRGREHAVANRLLQEAERWCEMKGVRQIYLGTTAEFLAAHRFYEKNGFHEINKSGLPKSFPVMSVDSKFFSRKL